MLFAVGVAELIRVFDVIERRLEGRGVRWDRYYVRISVRAEELEIAFAVES